MVGFFFADVGFISLVAQRKNRRFWVPRVGRQANVSSEPFLASQSPSLFVAWFWQPVLDNNSETSLGAVIMMKVCTN
jgi:hypothetical protein